MVAPVVVVVAAVAVVVVPVLRPAVPVPPVAAMAPAAVVVVAARAGGAGRPATWVVGFRRAELVGLGGNGHPDPVVVRLVAGPALPGAGVPGPLVARALRPRALGRLPVRKGRAVEARPADRDPLLAGRAPLHGDHHLTSLGLRPGTGRPPARRRASLGSAGPAARRPGPPWCRRLDLDDLGAPGRGPAGRAGPTPGGRTTPPAARWSPPSPPATCPPAPPRRGRRPAMCCGVTREAVPWGIGRRVVTARSIGMLIITLERFEPVGR